MVAYAVFDIEILDPVAWQEYVRLATVASEKYGPRPVMITTGTSESLEGDWAPHRLVVLQFDSVEEAKRWYYSPEYQEASAARWKAAKTKAVIVESIS